MPIFFYFPVIMGGAEQQARRLARELVSRGNRVTIVTGWWDRTTPQYESEHGVDIFRNSTLWDCFHAVKPLRMFKHYAYELTLAWHLWIRRRDYDVIHVHQALHAAFVACLMGSMLNKPVLVKLGCGGEFGDRQLMKGSKVSPLGHQFWKVIRNRCDVAVAISDEIREELLEDGFREEQLVAIPNGISRDAAVLKTDYGIRFKPHVVSVGRLDPQKGFELLLDSLVYLGMAAPSCTIFGEGMSRRRLEEQVTAHGLADKVTLPGVVNDLHFKLQSFDLFVLSSRSEGMSNALLEALYAGLPCIATNVGGNRDLIDPEGVPGNIKVGDFRICGNGILVNPDDSAGLAQAIRFLIENEEQRRTIGCRAHTWIEANLTIDVVADRYLKLYNNILIFHSSSDVNIRC